MTTQSRKATYRSRYLGRHLEAAVDRLMEAGTCASQAEVARFVDRDPSTFNRWLRGIAHPRTTRDWEALTALGFDRRFLKRVELLDKLDAWREDMGISVEELMSLAAHVHDREKGGQMFEVDTAQRRQTS